MRSALAPGEAAALVADGATVMIGGFMGVGSPHRVIAALVERGARGLTVIAKPSGELSAGCARDKVMKLGLGALHRRHVVGQCDATRTKVGHHPALVFSLRTPLRL